MLPHDPSTPIPVAQVTDRFSATAVTRPDSFVLPPLPYAEDVLVPTISARTVGLHYGKHHKGYYDKLNLLTAGTPY
eukprot:gene19008-38174_t